MCCDLQVGPLRCSAYSAELDRMTPTGGSFPKLLLYVCVSGQLVQTRCIKTVQSQCIISIDPLHFQIHSPLKLHSPSFPTQPSTTMDKIVSIFLLQLVMVVAAHHCYPTALTLSQTSPSNSTQRVVSPSVVNYVSSSRSTSTTHTNTPFYTTAENHPSNWSTTTIDGTIYVGPVTTIKQDYTIYTTTTTTRTASPGEY